MSPPGDNATGSACNGGPAAGLAAVCVGHSNSEHITLGALAKRIRSALPGLKVSVSRADRDPFEVV